MKWIATALTVAAVAGTSAALAHETPVHGKTTTAAAKVQQTWGIAGDAKAVTRTIEVSMSDTMRFTPDKIAVRRGETVRFVLHNAGRQMHEFVLGTRKELDAHAALMLKYPGMEHDEPYMAHVAPGQKGEIVWTFNRAGDFDFACLIAGHYQAGMVGKVKVVAATSTK
jgi:uncharacterized cupredoxin-like copper-binding protein